MVSDCSVCGTRCLAQSLQQIETEHHRNKVKVKNQTLLSFPKTSQTQYRCLDSSGAQLTAFFRKSNPQPVNSLRFKRTSTLYCTVPISVRLHGCHHCSLWSKKLAGDL